MDPITLIETLLMVIVIGLLIYIFKWIYDRSKLCGTDPLCYLTGNPNTMQYLSDKIENSLKNAFGI
jgi:hypothetical protein